MKKLIILSAILLVALVLGIPCFADPVVGLPETPFIQSIPEVSGTMIVIPYSNPKLYTDTAPPGAITIVIALQVVIILLSALTVYQIQSKSVLATIACGSFSDPPLEASPMKPGGKNHNDDSKKASIRASPK